MGIKKQKYYFIFLILVLCFSTVFAQNRQNEIQTTSQLGLSFYNDKDYEKAAPLFLEVYNLSRNGYYFRLYLTSLIELKKYNEAEGQIQKEIKKFSSPNPEFLIHWGYVLKAQEKNKEAEGKYKSALEATPPNKGNILVTANTFLQWQEYEWSKKVYLKGREMIPQEGFYYELARANLYLRNYEEMLEEYLDLIKDEENQISRVQSALSSAMRIDVDDGLRNTFRSQILRRIQSEPKVTAYNRLLIWFFLQERQFSGALRQSIALDRRTGQEDTQIFQLGQMAINNQMYNDAEQAFRYLTDKGEDNPFYIPAYVQSLHASYQRFTRGRAEEQSDGEQLAERFKDGLEMLGYHSGTLSLIIDYAHLQAFFLKEPDAAITILEKGLEIPRLKAEETGRLKAEIADIHVFAGDLWEAALLYSQVIDSNKNNLGDEVKLKKAKLSYFMGQFSWAKAQLDVLKASTSKLTANDAMELSMLIGNNLDLDSAMVPLRMFAQADLLFFRNKEKEAIAILDSISELFPYHTLTDNILFRKAKIEIDRNNFILATEYLQDIIDKFSYGLYADDALFILAELCNYQLNEREKTKELYRDMLTRYPGSIFIQDSRKKFRELREIYPDVLINNQEEILIQDSVPDEAN